MLVLSQSEREGLVVGNDIEIEVLEIRGRHVRLGISAPGHFRIMRRELEPENAERFPYLPPTDGYDGPRGDIAPLRQGPNPLRRPR